MLHAVAKLIEDVARELVLPRFGRLRHDEIEGKPTAADLSDIVTVVDRDAEVRLAAGLHAIAPAPVLGEEAAHLQPALLDLVGSDGPIWIVDPLDGTRNFASGSDAFGTMVGWAVEGRARAAWVHLPVRGETFVAQEGGGASLNGARIRVPPAAGTGLLTGSFFVRFMPQPLRERLLTAVDGRFREGHESGCSAVGYTDIVRGRKDFLVYYRLYPWDHAAPALVLTEAGGCVLHLDGTPYTVRSRNQVTIVARSAAVAEEVRSWLPRDA